MPGSAAKIELMRQRHDVGLFIHHPGDLRMGSDAFAELCRTAWLASQVKELAGVADVIDLKDCEEAAW